MVGVDALGKRKEKRYPPQRDLRSGVPAGSGDPRRALVSLSPADIGNTPRVCNFAVTVPKKAKATK